ncbi:hypothetical protein ACNAN0_03345 [Agrilactobacillus fermenti]|uniref:hypothetical protein n=1 Tax=Agrilactobacillus fermenti TaxID=2586909 RepID=UPI001E28ED58|nr:hypothetical protein [Agrilactobacillus fermenti]MCD2255463.1 hypothetical protein [Agrilactobacillus fermenti]
MTQLYLTLGSKSVLQEIQKNNPRRPLKLYHPDSMGEKDNLLLEVTGRSSVFKQPAQYDLIAGDAFASLRNFLHLFYFTFNDDENDHYRNRLIKVVTQLAQQDQVALLGIQKDIRKKFLLLTSWPNAQQYQLFQQSPLFDQIKDLADQSANDWSFYEISYSLE